MRLLVPKRSFAKRWSFLALLTLATQSFAAAPLTREQLLLSSERPSIDQVRSAIGMNGWNPTQIPDGTTFPKDPTRLEVHPEWQNNFSFWFDDLVKHSPNMIATFEKAYPGGTWVFIGRDMGLIADVFEAFYLSIGQSDRVIRLGMSSATLFSRVGNENVRVLSQDQAVGLLSSAGVNPQIKNKPYLFVDAVSRGGGTQGRALLGAIYDTYRKNGGDVSELLFYANFIGLKVRTTAIAERTVHNALELTAAEARRYRANPNLNFENEHKILTYDDGVESDHYHKLNEAGYTHWTGYWNESYGPVVKTQNGYRSTPGPQASLEMRTALLDLQALVWKAVSEPGYLRAVQAQATALGYAFPLTKPEYVADPRAKLNVELSMAQEPEPFTKAIESFKIYSFNRVPQATVMTMIDSAVASKNFALDAGHAARIINSTGDAKGATAFYRTLLNRTASLREKLMMHNWILETLKAYPKEQKEYFNFAAPVIAKDIKTSDSSEKVIDAFLSDEKATPEAREALLQHLYSQANNLSSQLKIVTRANSLLDSYRFKILADAWYAKLLTTAKAENRQSEFVLLASNWIRSADMKSYATQATLQLSLASSGGEFLKSLQSEQLKPVLSNPGLIGWQAFLQTLSHSGARAQDVNQLIKLIPDEQETILLGVLDVKLDAIKTQEDFNRLELPGLFSRSKKLKAALLAWKVAHDVPVTLGGKIKACTRSLRSSAAK